MGTPANTLRVLAAGFALRFSQSLVLLKEADIRTMDPTARIFEARTVPALK